MKNLGVVFLLLLFTSCGGQRPLDPQDRDGSFSAQGPALADSQVSSEAIPEFYGPDAPAAGEVNGAEAMGPPAPTEAHPQGEQGPVQAAGVVSHDAGKTCVLLGPGMARGVSHAGALEAIRKSGIPIQCIVGVEMGAVVGALYSQANGSPNSVQWNLFKLAKEIYLDFPLLALREPKARGQKLHQFLSKIFGNSRLEQLSIPFATVLVDGENGDAKVIRSGEVASVLSASVAIPGLFEPWKGEGGIQMSAALVSPAALEAAISLGGNFLILVDVLEEISPKEANTRWGKIFMPVRSILKLQKKEVSSVINVRVGAVPLDDFSKRGEAITAGRSAAEKVLPEIKAKWEASLAR